MRIIFVRHGHPDYVNDCLTTLGKEHGAAVAERLKDEPIEKIFSSSCGRAMETAEYIDSKFGIGVEPLAFMREIKWGPVDEEELYEDGHLWLTSDYLVEQGKSLMNPNWRLDKLYRKNKVIEAEEKIGQAFDEWLATLGYTREGAYYRTGEVKHRTVALVSHGGASSAVLAHLFNLPLPFVCSAICPDYTAVTIVNFEEKEGTLIAPRFELVNDAGHIRKKETSHENNRCDGIGRTFD